MLGLDQQSECLKYEVCVWELKIDDETSLDLSAATKHHPILYAENLSHSRQEGVANSTE